MRSLTFVRKMIKRGRYYVPEEREIIKTTKLYYDGKTQVPKRVIELLGLKPGRSVIVWVAERGKIHIESGKQVPR